MNYKATAVVKAAKDILNSKGVTNYNDTVFLLEKVLGKKCSILDSIELNEQEYAEYMELISRRSEHEPMDSLMGYTEFLGLTIPFSQDTLSPRQETEIMVDNIIRENKGRDNLTVLDLCSGSGCIGLAIAKHLGAAVTIVDISAAAIAVAEQNAKLNNVSVNIVSSDLFENVEGKYDIIVTNPPYIPSRDCLTLEKEVVDYDPILALDGGQDGLDLIRKIVKDSPNYLNKDGLIYMEYGIGQTEQIKRLFEIDFDNIEIVKDYSGIDRYIKGRKRDLC